MLDDGRTLDVANVIWCTGFRPDYGWIAVPDFVGDDGWPKGVRGAATAPGLYFLGIPFTFGFTSMLVAGAGRDAKHVVDRIAERAAPPAEHERSNARRSPRKLLHVDPCCTPELERGFDERVAARDLAAYRRDGLPADQRRLLAALVTDGLGGQTVLDIGGGIGAIHHDLLRAGARSVTDVDGSTAYLDAAREEARRQGDIDRIDYRHGDFVQLADGDRAGRRRHPPAGPVLLPGHAGVGPSVGTAGASFVRSDLSAQRVVDARGGSGV